MLVLKNGTLYYNGIVVHHEGETFTGAFNLLIFNSNYCYLSPITNDINSVIDDYIQCTGKQNFEVSVIVINF
jgi:hypothetical protein